MNIITISGRLTRDAEIRYNQNGFAVGHFTVAVDRPKRKDGDQEADFLPVVVFGKTAEFAEKYLAKGMKVGVVGRLQISKYETREGEKRQRAEILGDNVEVLEWKEKQTQQQTAGISDWNEEDFKF